MLPSARTKENYYEWSVSYLGMRLFSAGRQTPCEPQKLNARCALTFARQHTAVARAGMLARRVQTGERLSAGSTVGFVDAGVFVGTQRCGVVGVAA